MGWLSQEENDSCNSCERGYKQRIADLKAQLSAVSGVAEAQRQQIIRLQDQLAASEAERNKWREEAEAATKRANAEMISKNDAQREHAALKADAERYRWLRDCTGDHAEDTAWDITTNFEVSKWDAAIDAAMKGEK